MSRRTVVIKAEEANPAAFAAFLCFCVFVVLYLDQVHQQWDSFQLDLV